MNDIYLGYSGCILSISHYISQIIPYFDFSNKKFKYNNFQPIKIFFNYILTFFWYFFGQIIGYQPIKICNLVGIFIFLFIIFVYLYYELKKDLKNTILDAILVGIFSITFYHYFTYIVSDPNTNGKFCVAISIIIFLYNNYLIYKTIKNNDPSLVPIYSAIISFISSILWYKYGEINEDIYVKLSFGIESIIDFIQILIFCFCNKKYQKLNAKNIYVVENIDEV